MKATYIMTSLLLKFRFIEFYSPLLHMPYLIRLLVYINIISILIYDFLLFINCEMLLLISLKKKFWMFEM